MQSTTTWEPIGWVGTPRTSVSAQTGYVSVTLKLSREPDADWLIAFSQYYQQVPVSLAQRQKPPTIDAASDHIRFTVDDISYLDQWLRYVDQKIDFANRHYVEQVLPLRLARDRQAEAQDDRLEELRSAAREAAVLYRRPELDRTRHSVNPRDPRDAVDAGADPATDTQPSWAGGPDTS